VLPAGDLVVNMIKELLKHDYRREDIVFVLDKFRVKFEEEGNEVASDMVLGIMDRVTGWTSTQFRL